MDKVEYQERLEELYDFISTKDYKAAYDLVESIDWRKVKSIRTLGMVADIYEVNKDYDRCRDILEIALSRTSIGKSILYRLTEICLKQRDLKAAKEYYNQYVKISPKDNARLLLEYKISRATGVPIEDQIKILEAYKEREYTERWTYELATLYAKAGKIRECVDACDDMILWFSEGKYVLKAMELKKKYKELTPTQQLYYDKEQRDGDGKLVLERAEKGSYDEKPSAQEFFDEPDTDILQEELPKEQERKPKASVMDRISLAGAVAAGQVAGSEASNMPIMGAATDNFSVDSPEFMGSKADLRDELQKSINTISAEEKKNDDLPGEVDLNKLFRETGADFSVEVEKEQEEKPKDEALESEEPLETPQVEFKEIKEVDVSEFEEEKASALKAHKEEEEPVRAQEFDFSDEKQEEEGAEETPEAKPVILDDREIPDPEEKDTKKRNTHTLPINKIGQNTVPISIEEVLKNETPEERRIRILNNADVTKMNDQQRQIFTYFSKIPGMDSQILEAMSNVYEHAGEHTSNCGNIAIMGAVGTGKSRLSRNMICAMCKDMQLSVAKTARITGERMNRLDPAIVVARMSGGFLIIENAGDMSSKTINALDKAMEFKTDRMILIIEDEKNSMRALQKKYESFASKFSATISIPVFTNDELVTFARTYCGENNCQMDELAVLALYSIISNGQTQDQPMTISEVKTIIDSAISKAKRSNRRGKKTANIDKSVTLYEKDFA